METGFQFCSSNFAAAKLFCKIRSRLLQDWEKVFLVLQLQNCRAKLDLRALLWMRWGSNFSVPILQLQNCPAKLDPSSSVTETGFNFAAAKLDCKIRSKSSCVMETGFKFCSSNFASAKLSCKIRSQLPCDWDELQFCSCKIVLQN